MNSVALIGRLTADPQTHAGQKHESATFRLAVPRKTTPTKPEVSPGTPGHASTENRFSQGADFIDIVTLDKLAAPAANTSPRVGRWPLPNPFQQGPRNPGGSASTSGPAGTGRSARSCRSWPTPSSSSTRPRRRATLTGPTPGKVDPSSVDRIGHRITTEEGGGG